MFSSGSIAARPNLHFNPLHNSSALFQPNASGPLKNELTPIKMSHQIRIDEKSNAEDNVMGHRTIFDGRSNSVRPKMV
jgi:hypothetical protein